MQADSGGLQAWYRLSCYTLNEIAVYAMTVSNYAPVVQFQRPKMDCSHGTKTNVKDVSHVARFARTKH